MKNEEIYRQIDEKLWSKNIEKRQMRWLGHALRLPEQTPTKAALAYVEKKYNRPQGRPKLTWISAIKSTLKEKYNLQWEEACELAKDRVR